MIILENQNEISEAQNLLQTLLLKKFNQKKFASVNCLGGKFSEDLYYSASNHWYFYQNLDNKKYWNAFGFDEKNNQKDLRINCEINIPANGLNRSMAAAFATDGDALFLLHRGKIRGGKELFFKHFQGEVVQANDGNKIDDFAVISPLNEALPENLQRFIDEVIRIKGQK